MMFENELETFLLSSLLEEFSSPFTDFLISVRLTFTAIHFCCYAPHLNRQRHQLHRNNSENISGKWGMALGKTLSYYILLLLLLISSSSSCNFCCCNHFFINNAPPLQSVHSRGYFLQNFKSCQVRHEKMLKNLIKNKLLSLDTNFSPLSSSSSSECWETKIMVHKEKVKTKLNLLYVRSVNTFLIRHQPARPFSSFMGSC